MFGFLPPALVIHMCSPSYDHIYCDVVHGHYYAHACMFSKNIRHMIPFMPVLSVEISVRVIPRSSVQVLLQSYLILLPCVFLYVRVLPRASVHVPPRASMLMVAVTRVYLLLCTIHSCEGTLDMALG